MENMELRQKIKSELLAEQEMEKARKKVKTKKEMKENFINLIETSVKPQLEKMAMAISFTELLTEEKYFDSIISYFKERYDSYNLGK